MSYPSQTQTTQTSNPDYELPPFHDAVQAVMSMRNKESVQDALCAMADSGYILVRRKSGNNH